MFHISYDSWKAICDSYKNISKSQRKSYLQWFPLSNNNFLDQISNKEYFQKNISSGYIFFIEPLTLQTHHYIQKPDGTYREAQLVSPYLYILIQSISYELFNTIDKWRNENISVYYAGNFENLDLHYSKNYDLFYKDVNLESENYEYYIKLDINNFFKNIDINLIFDLIESHSNGQLKSSDIILLKELFSYCGNHKFPVLENSVGLSYLATEIFLSNSDNKLHKFLTEYEYIDSFKMIRYVDDLYILYDTNNSEISGINNLILSDIISNYSTFLNYDGLILNASKTKQEQAVKINDSLKTSFYNEFVNGKKFSLHKANILQLERFLEQYRKKIETNNTINYLEYNSLIEEFFTLEDTSISSREQFQKSIFNKELINGNREIILSLKKILSLKNFRIDTKNWITLILNTHNEKLIKLLLNQLFTKNRTNSLEKTDFHLAITYLLKRNFKNPDLLKIIKTNNPELYIYISAFCINQNVPYQFMEKLNIYSELKISTKSSKLYFLYLIELSKKNYFNAFAYYKTYFDSMTAEFDHYVLPNNENGKNRKINYKGFYKLEQLKNFYNFDKKDKHTIIDEAHDLRNENPLNHSSAKLLTGDKAIKSEITKVISELQDLLNSKIKELFY
ncbi:AbiA family abortive infection protein [Streptococcus uberis]